MPRKKLPYKVGDWFAVPLRTHGYGLGLVARANGRGTVLGYFFGPRRDAIPTQEDVIGLGPSGAVLVRRFGDLGFLEGEWPIVAHSENWDRNQWPLPMFGRIDDIDNLAWRVEYSEETLEEIRDTPIEMQEARDLPRAGLSGSGSVEIQLTMLLCPDVDPNSW